MIKITIKYQDEDKPRIIQILDTLIEDENKFVGWVFHSMWNDCYINVDIKSEYYNQNEWLCDTYFDIFYKGYNVFDWYNSSSGWIVLDNSYINIEAIDPYKDVVA